tara:strand:+ start:1316 stop:1975 length:660 start_codon:yes stop_codon:yes gene_type:complete
LETKSKNKFAKIFNVSRETIEILCRYSELICQANASLNLISKKSVDNIWIRHFADSAKLFFLIKENLPKEEISELKICDVGSGAGFPGAIVQLMLQQFKLKWKIDLIESVAKKCSFLESLKVKLNLNFSIINKRCENIKDPYDIIMCRAVAPLKDLIPIISNISHPKTIHFLSKGKKWRAELNEIKNKWQFNLDVVNNNKSIDDSGGVVLIMRDLGKKK